MELKEHKKELIEDKELLSDVRTGDLSQKRLHRIFAVRKTFHEVSFKQSEITECYMRNCRFIGCDFTGANISNSNFYGSRYDDCRFEYSTWSHTLIDEEFLRNCLPSEENLARDLTRSLRVNFSQIGNYSAVNKAASIEVKLTGEHLFNAAYSRQSHYRKKHKGWKRVGYGLSHARWKTLDLLWGNGESLRRIFVTSLAIIVVAAIFLAWGSTKYNWSSALGTATTAFWGIQNDSLPWSYLVSVTVARYILAGLFLAVLIKRLSRR
jgi:hypothetical protein